MRVAAINRTAIAATLLLACAGSVAACGEDEAPRAVRGCVVVDVSGSARPEISRMYLPGFQRFIQRLRERGGEDVCFAFAAAGTSGGGSAWAKFACRKPDDRLTCKPEVRRQVEAAATQLSTWAKPRKGPDPFDQLRGASQLVETVALLASNTAPGDEILVLGDGVQNSRLTGHLGGRVDLSDASIDAMLGRLAAKRLLPSLAGRTVRIPYALTWTKRPNRMSAARRLGVRAFWREWERRTGAKLVFGGGTGAA